MAVQPGMAGGARVLKRPEDTGGRRRMPEAGHELVRAAVAPVHVHVLADAVGCCGLN